MLDFFNVSKVCHLEITKQESKRRHLSKCSIAPLNMETQKRTETIIPDENDILVIIKTIYLCI